MKLLLSALLGMRTRKKRPRQFLHLAILIEQRQSRQ